MTSVKVDLSQYKIWTVQEFEQVFPPSRGSTKPNGKGTVAQGGASGAGAGVDEIDEADLADDLLEWIHDGEPEGSGKRSTTFFIVVKALKRLGYSAEAIFELLVRYPDGIAHKYLDRNQAGSRMRLQREVNRAFDRPRRVSRPSKAPPPVPRGAAAAGSAPSSAATPSSAPVSPTPGASTLLVQTVAVYRKWLALKDDWRIYVTLGAIAANLLEGEPVWLGLIGPSSSAKTELLKSVSHLSYAHVVETFSPAGLLSGSSKKSRVFGATGGVLKKLGQFGVLLFMDFGSVLSLRQDPQAEMVGRCAGFTTVDILVSWAVTGA